MQLHYLTSDHRYTSGLSSYFEAQGNMVMPYCPGKVKESGLILLIFSPVLCGRVRVSPEALWKKMLAIENPSAILLNAGFEEIQEANYFDVLNPPQNWADFIASAKQASDDWTPFYTGGLKMDDKLARFFKGHGSESLIAELSKISRKIKTIHREITQFGTPYESVAALAFDTDYTWNSWETLKSRWGYYFPLFYYLPFFEEMKTIDAAIQHINPFFEAKGQKEELFTELKCHDKVVYIYETLSIIETDYA